MAEQKGDATLTKEYLEVTSLIERMHRRYLDVIRTELNRMKVRDINAVQGMLLANIGQEEIVIRDLIERGYYQGSNVSYNLKKLAELGYIVHERSDHDRRSVRISLTPQARRVVTKIRELEARHSAAITEKGIEEPALAGACQPLLQVEHIWTDYIRGGRR